MLNREELLIKIMQLLDIDMKDIKLKQTLEKQRFITKEESSEKYKEHLKLIFDSLNLDKYNVELHEIFQELLFLYMAMYDELLKYRTKDNIKKINWIILKRLIVPFLAYKFANLDIDYDKRIDKNMPGGIFWYLPNTEDSNNIIMPIPYLMNWWIDLYGKGLDSLCNEIDEDYSEEKANESKDILKPWKYKGVIPDSKSLKLYLSNDLTYNGVFQPLDTVNTELVYSEAISFVQKTKGLTIEKVKKELPYHWLLDEVFSSNKVTVSDKKKFIQLVKERWSVPSKESLIRRFLIARAVQDIYGKLISYFNFKNSNDIEENKMLQLVYQYNVLYNMQMERLKNKLDENELYYEMIQPFYNPLNEIITTIGGDISIELTNPNSEEYVLEDNYLLKVLIFLQHQDKRVEKAYEDHEVFYNYFHKEFDDIDQKIKYYDALDEKTFLNELSKESSFQLLMNLYGQNQSVNYHKAEHICFQMSKVAKSIPEEIQSLAKFTTLYSDSLQQENQSKFNDAKHLLEQLISLLQPQNNALKANEKDILLIQANFHLKAKDFTMSLKYYNEFFDLYIYKQKKKHFSDIMAYLAAYSAYTIKDKVKLKKYNKYLKKQNLQEFKTQKSLPFPIYFYN